jgi:hypothetical protein
MTEESEYSCSATLIILGDDLVPENVTELLKIEPNQMWRMGERKSFVRRDGTVEYFDSIYERGGWKAFIPDEKEDLELHEQLTYWCDLLEGRESVMHELEGQGCWLQINCYVSTSATASIILSADLQRRLANLRLELSFSIFADEVSSEGEA